MVKNSQNIVNVVCDGKIQAYFKKLAGRVIFFLEKNKQACSFIRDLRVIKTQNQIFLIGLAGLRSRLTKKVISM